MSMRKSEVKGIKCPDCFSDDIVKHGVKNTVSKGKRQRYMCNKCAHTFYKEEDR
jgi:transposase-like protein